MIEVDRIMTEDLGIEVPLMMEHAGLNLAKLAVQIAEKNNSNRYVIFCGSGNNGGGGMGAARRLHNWGFNVVIFLPKGEPKNQVPKLQLNRAKKCGVIVTEISPKIEETDLIIDAYIGYNFRGNLREDAILVIDKMKSGNLISLDIPSGIDSNTGENHGQLMPLATLTLAWPKSGFLKLTNKYYGDLYLADIGVPDWVYQKKTVRIDVNLLTNQQLNFFAKKFSIDSLHQISLTNESWVLTDSSD